MPSLFAGLAAAASATVDTVYGEGFRIEMREAPPIAAPGLASGRPDVNARPVASALRVDFEFIGVFLAPGAVLHAHGRGMSDATTRPIVAEQPMIDVDVGSLTERPRVDDVIRRIDTDELFRVATFKAVEFRRALITLTEIR